MTIEFRHPRSDEEPALRALFTEAFEDKAFTELFFRTGFDPERCLGAFDGELLAALHWFDCTLEGRKAAYVYGIAAFRSQRGRGIGSALIREAQEVLKSLSYEAVLLVPAEASLFGYYERFGFRAVSAIDVSTVSAGAPLPVRKLTAAEYAEARRRLAPERTLIQEGPFLQLLAGYADFYATPGAVAAVSGQMFWELLGDPGEAAGLAGALDLPEVTIRTPGEGRPFAMATGVEGHIHLGLALD